MYVRDSGILHTLLRLPDMDALSGHPKFCASWEGFALEQVLRRIGERDVYFWATHGGAELDLLFFRGGKRYGIEFKYGDVVTATKSMRVAMGDLKLEKLWVVHGGRDSYPIDDRIQAVPLADFDL